MSETDLQLMAAQFVLSADLRALVHRVQQLERALVPQHPKLAEADAAYVRARTQLLQQTLLGLEARQPGLAARLTEKIEASYPDLRF